MSPESENSEAVCADDAARLHDERVTETFRREHRKLVAWLRLRAPAHVAEEIAAQSFTELAERKPGSVDRMAPYVFRTASRLLVNYYKYRDVRVRGAVLLRPEESDVFPSIESLLMGEQHEALLREAISTLRPRRRFVMEQLLLPEKVTYRDIVERFAERGIEISERTVMRYFKEGLDVCRQAIEAAENPEREARR